MAGAVRVTRSSTSVNRAREQAPSSSSLPASQENKSLFRVRSSSIPFKSSPLATSSSSKNQQGPQKTAHDSGSDNDATQDLTAIASAIDGHTKAVRGLNVTQFQSYLSESLPVLAKKTLRSQVLLPLAGPLSDGDFLDDVDVLLNAVLKSRQDVAAGKGKGKAIAEDVDPSLLRKWILCRILVADHIIKSIDKVTGLRYFFRYYRATSNSQAEKDADGLVLYYKCAQTENEDPTCFGTLRVEIKDLGCIPDSPSLLSNNVDTRRSDLPSSPQLGQRSRANSYILENPLEEGPVKRTPSRRTYLTDRVSNRKPARPDRPVLVLRVKLTHLNTHKHLYIRRSTDHDDESEMASDDEVELEDADSNEKPKATDRESCVADARIFLKSLSNKLDNLLKFGKTSSIVNLRDSLEKVFGEVDGRHKVTARAPPASQKATAPSEPTTPREATATAPATLQPATAPLESTTPFEVTAEAPATPQQAAAPSESTTPREVIAVPHRPTDPSVRAVHVIRSNAKKQHSQSSKMILEQLNSRMSLAPSSPRPSPKKVPGRSITSRKDSPVTLQPQRPENLIKSSESAEKKEQDDVRAKKTGNKENADERGSPLKGSGEDGKEDHIEESDEIDDRDENKVSEDDIEPPTDEHDETEDGSYKDDESADGFWDEVQVGAKRKRKSIGRSNTGKRQKR